VSSFCACHRQHPRMNLSPRHGNPRLSRQHCGQVPATAAPLLRGVCAPPPSAASSQTWRHRSFSSARGARETSVTVSRPAVTTPQRANTRERHAKGTRGGCHLPEGELLERQPAAAVSVERVDQVARRALHLCGGGTRLAVGRKERHSLARVDLARAVCRPCGPRARPQCPESGSEPAARRTYMITQGAGVKGARRTRSLRVKG
jgi:hypothetical protein